MEDYLKMSRTAGAGYSSIMKRLNLIEPRPNFEGTQSEVQLLKNVNSRLEYLYIRPGKSFPAYHRLDLVMQRLEYLSSMGMTPKDKLALLKRQPPVLVVCEHELIDSSGMAYLRGIVKDGPNLKYVFYPAFPRTMYRKPLLDIRLDGICETLKASREQVLKIAMNIPCFSLNSNAWEKYQDKIICMHRQKLPEQFNLDLHTFHVLPPVFSGLLNCHLLNHLESDQLPDPAGAELSDLLDLTYTAHNGKGKPEDYTEFMNRSYSEEHKYKPPLGKFK